MASKYSVWVPDTEVAAAFGVSRSTVWRWVKAGLFPAPVKIGPNTSRFNRDWISDRVKRAADEAA